MSARLVLATWVHWCLLTTACGGAAKEPETAAAKDPSAASAPARPEAAPASSVSAEAPGTPAPKAPEDDTKAAPEPSAPAEANTPRGRDITYRATPGGLVIEVDGVRLEPKAEPVKLAGGWGVKLTLRATSTDGHMHRLLSPENGPLMLAAEIDRGGKKERIGDERKGDGEQFITENDSLKVEREFKKPLCAGLWGLGRDAEDRKPIKKLFTVKMVAGTKKPQPVVSAPE
jgi:hypothetical protein